MEQHIVPALDVDETHRLHSGQGSHVARILLHRIMRITKSMSLLVAVLAVSACSQGLPDNSTYSAMLPHNTLLTLRLQRMGNNQVEGTLQATSINATNSVEDLPASNFSGRLYQHNLTLTSANSADKTTFLGQVRGDTIALSFGNAVTVFHRVDEKQHAAEVAVLQKKAAESRDYHNRRAEVAGRMATIQAQVKELTEYIEWEPKFTQDVAGLQAWYATQISQYQRCLAQVQSAAAAGVEVWRWQQCALQANTASFARQQTLQNLEAVEAKQNSMFKDIDAALSEETDDANDIVAQANGMVADCDQFGENENKSCQNLRDALATGPKKRFIFNKENVANFRLFQLEATVHMSKLETLRTQDAPKLESLASQIEAVYNNAVNRH